MGLGKTEIVLGLLIVVMFFSFISFQEVEVIYMEPTNDLSFSSSEEALKAGYAKGVEAKQKMINTNSGGE